MVTSRHRSGERERERVGKRTIMSVLYRSIVLAALLLGESVTV